MKICHESLYSLPNLIKKDIIVYSMPLFFLSVNRSEHDYFLFWLTSIGAGFGLIPMKSKHKLICSAVLYLIHVFIPISFYFCLGFSLFQAYNCNVMSIKKQEINIFISKLEIIGWLCSEIINIPRIIQLMIGSVLVFVSITCDPPCIESEDPFEEMKKRIESPALVNLEYRHFIKNESEQKKSIFKDFYPFLFEIVYMAGTEKIWILFFSFFSFEISEYLIFLIGILAMMEFKWEILIILLKGSPSGNIYPRIITSMLSAYLSVIINNFLKNANNL